jgi:hypothetical protein
VEKFAKDLAHLDIGAVPLYDMDAALRDFVHWAAVV